MILTLWPKSCPIWQVPVSQILPDYFGFQWNSIFTFKKQSIHSFLHLVASLFHTDFSYSTPLLLPWARFFHLPLKPKSKGNKTQSQKQHKGQDTNYYPAWKYLHKLMCCKCRKWKIHFKPITLPECSISPQ